MSKIKPHYILGLSIVLFFLSLLFLNSKKEQLKILEQHYNQKFALAQEFKLLKSNYKNKEQKINQIKALKTMKLFKKGKLSINEDKKSIKVIFETQDDKLLSKFLNYVLQRRFNYKKFKVSLNKVSFEVDK